MFGIPYYGSVRAEWAFLVPVLLLFLVVVLVFFLRWFNHRERMAMIERGMVAYPSHPGFINPEINSKRHLARGLTTSLVGVAITLGLLTIGIGPWLLLGLIPLFIGLAMILSHLITLPDSPKSEAINKPESPKEKLAKKEPTPQVEQPTNLEVDEEEVEYSDDKDQSSEEDKEEKPF